MDIVFIEALRVETLIGIYDWERRAKQPVVIDLEMAFDNRVPAATDRIEDTLDYSSVIIVARDFLQNSQFLLLETLAESLCQHLFSKYPVQEICASVSKPLETLGVKSAGIRIQRKRESING